MRLPFLLAACAALVPVAHADTLTLPAGLWAYEGVARIGPMQLSDDGSECVTPGAATYNLAEVARSIAPGCALTAATPLGDGVTFAVACTGDVQGELEGAFTFTETEAQLTAQGWTGEPSAPVALAVTAQATRVSQTCDG